MRFIKSMCGNCPFRKDGKAIVLRKGRVAGIAKELLSSDHNTFSCHKTVYSKNGGECTDEGEYIPSGQEAFCAGAVGFSSKHGMVAVATRLALAMGDLTVEDLRRLEKETVDSVAEVVCE